MTRVLVVDDEPSQREYVSRFLAMDGHEVETAASGREAITIGAHFEPDVLVADWMLRNHVHGLNVSEALRMLNPEMKTIVITGYPSESLKKDAERARVFEFIEKPFDPESIRSAVMNAKSSEGPKVKQKSLALFEVDPEGLLIHSSDEAKRLFNSVSPQKEVSDLAAIFPPTSRGRLEQSEERWIDVETVGEPPRSWSVRRHRRHDGGSFLFVILPKGEGARKNDRLVELILDLPSRTDEPWPFPGRVLIVDDEEVVLNVFGRLLERAHCLCHKARTHEEALRLFASDPGIDTIVLDHDMPGASPAKLVTQFKAERPGTRFIGMSGIDHRDDFLKVGVKLYLEKPWRVAELIDLVRRENEDSRHAPEY